MNINIDWTKLGIAFAVQAVFLTFALVAMLRQQKLKPNIFGLLASILLACALVQIPYAGIAFSFIVALLCITKTVGARTFTDAIVAVGVAFALFAAFNYAAVPPLTGVLLPLVKVRARTTESVSAPAPASTNNAVAVASNNRPVATNASPVVGASPESPAKAADAAPATATAPSAPVEANATTAAPTPASAPAPVPAAEPVFDTNRLNAVRLAGDIMKHFYVKGVSQGATISIAMISNGTRNFDIVAGEVVQLQTTDGRYAAVKCESVGDDQVIVSVEGVKISLFRR
jgi:hypothetical protein